MLDAGFNFTYGDAFRDPRCPYGSKVSKHKRRLAIDINLFADLDGDGEADDYCKDTERHRPFGEWWEAQGGVWGGRFPGGDGNHYEWKG
jgi:hypothetical protein